MNKYGMRIISVSTLDILVSVVFNVKNGCMMWVILSNLKKLEPCEVYEWLDMNITNIPTFVVDTKTSHMEYALIMSIKHPICRKNITYIRCMYKK